MAGPAVAAPAAGPAPGATSFAEPGEATVVPDLPAPVCVPAPNPEDLTAFFDLGAPLLGADHQRAFTLPDGRVLWLFQDGFLTAVHGPELVHNVDLLQGGSCSQLLRTGTAEAPAPYLFAELTDRFDRWYRPLGGGVGADGNLYVFVAELHERGSGYLAHTEPVATRLVSIELEHYTVVDAQLAPNPSSDLYGWSVVSHGDHSYLDAHCYRQFGWDPFPFADPPFRAHDRSCGPEVTVARVPVAEFGATPEYWTGSKWTADPEQAAPVIPSEGRSVNPTQVLMHGGRFVAVTRVGDW